MLFGVICARIAEHVGGQIERAESELQRAHDLLEAKVEARTRRWNWLTGDDYHRVLRLHGDTWTLFLTGPRRDDWGFLVDGEHVPWKKYLGIT